VPFHRHEGDIRSGVVWVPYLSVRTDRYSRHLTVPRPLHPLTRWGGFSSIEFKFEYNIPPLY